MFAAVKRQSVHARWSVVLKRTCPRRDQSIDECFWRAPGQVTTKVEVDSKTSGLGQSAQVARPPKHLAVRRMGIAGL